MSHISQALQLDADERKHLFDLAAPDPISFSMTQRSDKPDTGFLQNLVDQMRYPSFIANEFADMIVWNRGAELVVADFARLPESERNMVTLLFLDPEYPKRLVNWEEFARYMTALIRAGFDSNKNNPMYMERYERLRRNSEDFVRLWEWHEIRQKSSAPVHYLLPDEQELAFTIHCAAIDNNPGLQWCFFVPTPGSGTEERLAILLKQDAEWPPQS